MQLTVTQPASSNDPVGLAPYLLNSTEYIRILTDLEGWQQQQIQEGEASCPIPLGWAVLAELAGLTVDLETGLIVDGPQLAS
jgi:hypothetical protein